MSNLVLTGIGNPLFYGLYTGELCTNPILETDLTDWYAGDCDTYARGAVDNFYGDYILNLGDSSAAYSRFSYYSTPVTYSLDYQYAIMIHVRLTSGVEHPFKIQALRTSSPYTVIADSGQLTAKSVWQRITLVTSIAAGITDSIAVKIFPAGTVVTDTGGVYVTKVSIVKINKLIQFDNYPMKVIEEFDPEEQFSYKLQSGKLKETLLGYRYLYHADWNYLFVNDEYDRREIQRFNEILLIPHADVSWGIYMKNNKTIKSEWAKQKLVGHEGELNLRAIELIEYPPIIINTI